MSRLHPSVHHTLIFLRIIPASILSTVLFYAINWASEQVVSVRKKSVTLDIFECCLHGSRSIRVLEQIGKVVILAYMLLGLGSVLRATPAPWAELRSGVQ
jgi:hypothetical protein